MNETHKQKPHVTKYKVWYLIFTNCTYSCNSALLDLLAPREPRTISIRHYPYLIMGRSCFTENLIPIYKCVNIVTSKLYLCKDNNWSCVPQLGSIHNNRLMPIFWTITHVI